MIMPKELIIIISADDESDLEFVRSGAVARVEEYVEDTRENGTFDSDVEVNWEWRDE
jgi:hypothetical protein